jgi:FixJ family two-component response regulator
MRNMRNLRKPGTAHPTTRALTAGATAFFSKPPDPAELLEAVATAIARSTTLINEE